jgi:DNA polymerase-3 subunit gamma/tau
MDVVVEISRAQALKDAYVFAGPQEWAKRTKAMGELVSPAQSARMWRMLLQGFEDCARAPDPPTAAQMVVLRLTAVTSLPSPEDAARLLAAGAAVPSPKSQPEAPRAPARVEPMRVETGRMETGRVDTGRVVTPSALAPQAHEEEHGDIVRLSSLREIVAELDARREIELKYDIERFVRPAEIDFGHFRYTAAPNAPHNLSQRIKDWLEDVTRVEWDVLQANDGGAESVKELRTRKGVEKMRAIEAIPRVAEALRVFPGARVLRVDDADPADDLEDFPSNAPQGANVIHVDFSYRDRVEETIPDPEEREDDE